ncbi:Scr1 family TA system antitoxin-like transcriptional regulator [Nocardia sp. NPDC127606]|uniref:Scr1 family TA system antitoxin-like transcriptional regulator n=1 Tax=Nocardia sp. NPDC127606 TaxID=3345406 RepID=UPI0036325872
MAIIEQALGWSAGSAREVLSGREPWVVENATEESQSAAQRALGEAYRIAADIIQTGDGSHGARLGQVLGDLSESLRHSPGSGAADPTERADDVPTAGMMIPRANQTVLRIALGTYLRDQREERGISIEEVSERIGCEPDVLESVESGSAKFDRNSVGAVLTSYGVNDPAIHRDYKKLTDTADQSGWWTEYSDVLPAWFKKYLSLEHRAILIRAFEAQYVPGLLQTANYAESVIKQMIGDDGLNRRVSLRMERQRLVLARGGTKLRIVIDECVLHRVPEGADMAVQIQHIMDAAQRGNITVQILPMSNYETLNPGSFSLLRFDDKEMPDLVYMEQLSSALYFDRPNDIEKYRRQMDLIETSALTPEESLDFLADLRTRGAVPTSRSRSQSTHRSGLLPSEEFPAPEMHRACI